MNRRPIANNVKMRSSNEVIHAGTNEELDVIAESMNLLWGQTSALKTHGFCVEEGGGDGSECGLTTVTDALSAKARAWKV